MPGYTQLAKKAQTHTHTHSITHTYINTYTHRDTRPAGQKLGAPPQMEVPQQRAIAALAPPRHKAAEQAQSHWSAVQPEAPPTFTLPPSRGSEREGRQSEPETFRAGSGQVL